MTAGQSPSVGSTPGTRQPQLLRRLPDIHGCHTPAEQLVLRAPANDLCLPGPTPYRRLRVRWLQSGVTTERVRRRRAHATGSPTLSVGRTHRAAALERADHPGLGGRRPNRSGAARRRSGMRAAADQRGTRHPLAPCQLSRRARSSASSQGTGMMRSPRSRQAPARRHLTRWCDPRKAGAGIQPTGIWLATWSQAREYSGPAITGGYGR
jgi:hypothetical protein